MLEMTLGTGYMEIYIMCSLQYLHDHLLKWLSFVRAEHKVAPTKE